MRINRFFKLIGYARPLLVPLCSAAAGAGDPVKIDRLAAAFAGRVVQVPELREKVASELLCASNIPPTVARVAFTNLVRLPNGWHFELSTAAHCARFMPSWEVLRFVELDRPDWDLLCCLMARLSSFRAELQPTLEHLARASAAERVVAAHIVLGSLERTAEGHEEHIIGALRDGDELRRGTIGLLERSGAVDVVSQAVAKELVGLPLDGHDELRLVQVAAILGSLGSEARPLADRMERAWRREMARTGPVAGRDMVVRTALAKMRGRWNERTARAVLKDAGGGCRDEGDRAIWFAMDTLCYRLLSDADFSPVFRLLGDRDPKVVLGAARFCYLLGARARGAEAALFAALKRAKDKQVREELIRAIASVGSRQTAVKLEELGCSAVSVEEREALGEAVRLIRETGEILGQLFP